jgi:hypothetical protein
MLDANRGRLRAGRPRVVGGINPRRPLSPVDFSAVLLPAVLFAALIAILFHSLPDLSSRLHASLNGAVNQPDASVQSYNAEDGLDRRVEGAELLKVFTPEVQQWSTSIVHWAQAYGLPPQLVAIVMQIESCGDPQAVSPAGAQGLFQVMPFHFGRDEDMLLPETNAARGLDYLQQAYRLADGRIDLTLAGYNGGHSQISRSSDAWPQETRRYVQWGTGIWNDLQAGHSSSSTLADWLSAGGSRLCQGARVALAAR